MVSLLLKHTKFSQLFFLCSNIDFDAKIVEKNILYEIIFQKL